MERLFLSSPIVALVFWWCHWRQTQSDPPWVAWSLITCLPARRCSPFDCNGISSISCLLVGINERQWKQSSSPSSSSSSPLALPAQPKQRPAVGLIISSNGRDPGPVCANTHRDGAGKGWWWGGGGNRLTERWGFNKRQPASALFGWQIIAGWCSIILQPKIAVERKVQAEGVEGRAVKQGGGERAREILEGCLRGRKV